MVLPSKELLDDLCTRFILNSPPEELASFERLLFLVEQAHWFYEDFVREADPSQQLASLSLKRFATLVFNTCPGLKPYSNALDAIYKQFNEYKQVVPVMGAIMLNPELDKCLLVKGWGASGAWGFPRGKVNPAESDIDCAAREVLEETGFDLRGRLRDEDSIELHIGQKRTRLYIVAGIDESTYFAPQVRKEISALAWFPVSHLPASKDQDTQVYTNLTGERHKFFMVYNYVRQLRRWIREQRRAGRTSGAASKDTRAKSAAAKRRSGRPQSGKQQKGGGGQVPSDAAAAAAAAAAVALNPAVRGAAATAAAAAPASASDSEAEAAATELDSGVEARSSGPGLAQLLADAAAAAQASGGVSLQGVTPLNPTATSAIAAPSSGEVRIASSPANVRRQGSDGGGVADVAVGGAATGVAQVKTALEAVAADPAAAITSQTLPVGTSAGEVAAAAVEAVRVAEQYSSPTLQNFSFNVGPITRHLVF